LGGLEQDMRSSGLQVVSVDRDKEPACDLLVNRSTYRNPVFRDLQSAFRSGETWGRGPQVPPGELLRITLDALEREGASR
jgi:hypothetical protein